MQPMMKDQTPRNSRNVGQGESYCRAIPISPANEATTPQKMLAAGPPATYAIRRRRTCRTLSRDMNANPQNSLGLILNFHLAESTLILKGSILTPLKRRPTDHPAIR